MTQDEGQRQDGELAAIEEIIGTVRKLPTRAAALRVLGYVLARAIGGRPPRRFDLKPTKRGKLGGTKRGKLSDEK